MEEINKVKEYALANYKKLFKKVKITRVKVKGKIVSREVIDLDPIIVDGGNHWRVSNHIDASPLILSKGIV